MNNLLSDMLALAKQALITKTFLNKSSPTCFSQAMAIRKNQSIIEFMNQLVEIDPSIKIKIDTSPDIYKCVSNNITNLYNEFVQHTKNNTLTYAQFYPNIIDASEWMHVFNVAYNCRCEALNKKS